MSETLRMELATPISYMRRITGVQDTLMSSNEMDPEKLPVCLPELSQVEEMIINRRMYR